MKKKQHLAVRDVVATVPFRDSQTQSKEGVRCWSIPSYLSLLIWLIQYVPHMRSIRVLAPPSELLQSSAELHFRATIWSGVSRNEPSSAALRAAESQTTWIWLSPKGYHYLQVLSEHLVLSKRLASCKRSQKRQSSETRQSTFITLVVVYVVGPLLRSWWKPLL